MRALIVICALVLISCTAPKPFAIEDYMSRGAEVPEGDGVTDRTIQLQALINHAAIDRRQVHLGTGVFIVSNTITIPSGVSLIGDGPGGSVIQASESFTNPNGVIRTIESGNGQPPGRIEGLTINGNLQVPAAVPGVYLGANASSLVNCWVGAFSGPHVVCASTNQIVSRCVIDNGIAGSNCSGIRITAPHVQVETCTVYMQKYGIVILNPTTLSGNGPIKLTDINICNPYVGGNAVYIANNNGLLVQMNGIVASSDTAAGYEETGAFAFINANRVTVTDCHVNWAGPSLNIAFGIHATSLNVVLHGCSSRNAGVPVAGTVTNHNFTAFP